MLQLHELIANNEDWLLQKVIEYFKAYGYARYSSTLKEAWRIAIAGMSDTILKALENHAQPPALDPDLNYKNDPIAGFGILEARKHRARGVTRGMFLGGLKCYRQGYIDLVRQAGFTRDDEERCCLFVHRVFDRVEIALCMEWDDTPPNDLIEILQTSNRNIINEKNKYLTICESLPNPVLIFDQNNNIESMNYAAMVLFGGKCIPGQYYYTKPSINISIPWLTEALNSFKANSSAERVSLEKQIAIKDTTYCFELKFNSLLDISGKFTGAVVILNDLTEIRRVEEERRKSEQAAQLTYKELNQIFTTAGDAMWVIDNDFNVMRVNDAFVALTGVSKEESIGKKCYDLFYDNYCNTRDCPLFRIIGGDERVECDVLKESNGGVKIPCILTATPLRNPAGEIIGIVENFKDITERKLAEERLKKSEERFRLLAENACDIIYRMQLEPVLRLEYVSPAAGRITGYTPEEFYADPYLNIKILHPDDRSVWNKITTGTSDYTRPTTVRWLPKGGGVIWVEHRNVPIYDAQGRLVALEGIARDITERMLMEEQLRYLSFHDPLTGLYNRAYFEQEMQRLENLHHHPVGIIICDIDELKLVNDSLGHRAGDQMLIAAANVLMQSFRKSDVVARIGGDEFAVLLPDTDLNIMEQACRRIVNAQTNNHPGGSLPKLSISVGFAVSNEQTASLIDVFREADNHMYQEKVRGKKINS